MSKLILWKPLKQPALDLYVKYFVRSGLLKLVLVAANFGKMRSVCEQLKIQYVM
jgi:hypothetical protein